MCTAGRACGPPRADGPGIGIGERIMMAFTSRRALGWCAVLAAGVLLLAPGESLAQRGRGGYRGGSGWGMGSGYASPGYGYGGRYGSFYGPGYGAYSPGYGYYSPGYAYYGT